MNSIELTDLYTWAILVFLESAEDLGYDEKTDGNVRDWFTKQSPEDMEKIVSQLLDKIEEPEDEDA
jgi:hypothetical protein